MIEKFREAMLNAGIDAPESIINDGKIHRVGKSIWYVIDGNHGAFGDWKTGQNHNWIASKDYKMTEDEWQAIKQRKEAARMERQLTHAEIATKAQYIFNKAGPATFLHPYISRKKIHPYGARISSDGRLIIPIYDIQAQIVNLQFINDAGEKRFLKNGLKKGCFYLITDKDESSSILICEGFATGASLHKAFHHPTVVAFDAGNLLPVAQNVRLLYPDHRILICGDNDLSGVGQKYAHDAAKAIDALVLLPDTPGNDWNDELSR